MNKSFFDPFSFASDFPKQFNTTVGFEPILKRLAEMSETLPKISAYPPYNIKKTGDTTYVIEMAVAGFGRQDLELELQDGKLTIKGNVHTNDTDDNYIFKGIAERAFTRQFELADTDLINGMLKIWLERFIPEDKKPKKINIGEEPKTESKKELLAESGNNATKEYLQDRSDK
jgi:molecular chaperone IbpA